MQPSTRMRSPTRVLLLCVLGLLGTACLLRYSSATGWHPTLAWAGAFTPTAVRSAEPHWVRVRLPVMEGKGKLAPRTYVEGETDVLGRPLDDERKANIMKADQARKEFDERNGIKSWSGTLGDQKDDTSSKRVAAGQIQTAFVEGETDVLGRPLDDETKANIAKADQARKEFDLRNNKKTWFGPLGKKEEDESGGSGPAYMQKAGLFGNQEDAREQAARMRAEFRARNGEEEWYDVSNGARVGEYEDESYPLKYSSRVAIQASQSAMEGMTPEMRAAQQRADYMARNGKTEWLDVVGKDRLDRDDFNQPFGERVVGGGPGVYPAEYTGNQMPVAAIPEAAEPEKAD